MVYEVLPTLRNRAMRHSVRGFETCAEEPESGMHYTVGMTLNSKSEQAAVEAEDALAAALRVKDQYPDAMITYVRKRNERGDRRHPHKDLTSPATARAARTRKPRAG